MPALRVAESLLLPELRFLGAKPTGFQQLTLQSEKTSSVEVCPRCATASSSIYDHRTVRVKDSPVRNEQMFIEIRKRRFFCAPCRKPFTEPVPGIRKGGRVTERYRRYILWAAERFSSLKDVRRAAHCSSGFIYKTLFAELEKRRRMRLYPWPKTLGLDEHFFRRRNSIPEFASIFVDYRGRRIMEVAAGRAGAELEAQVGYIPGRENVRNVVIDMCQPFRAFVQNFFPNARIIADKFHVLRLLNPAINRHRKAITGDKRKLPVRILLLRSGHELDYFVRKALNMWLEHHPQLAEIYRAKEALHRLYRTRGRDKAALGLTWITDQLATSSIPELKTLRRTLISWRTEILNYFDTGLTNGRTEGFNNVAKLVKKRAFGYRCFNNYRLRLLNACAG